MPLFVGGCADGREIEIRKVGGRYPPVQYVAHILSLGEIGRLQIDDTTTWRPPEDIYYLRDDEYVFNRTVRYGPPLAPQREVC